MVLKVKSQVILKNFPILWSLWNWVIWENGNVLSKLWVFNTKSAHTNLQQY